MRTCAVSREKHAPGEMIRFVLSPSGDVTPDIRCKLPGRGVWILARADQVRLAVKRQVFSRALRPRVKAKGEPHGVATPPDLDVTVDALLEADALQSLSLANKAGLVVAGFAKVEAAIAGGNVVALLQASGGGGDGARKLGQAVRRAGTAGIADINIFAGLQLDLALGRSNVIHAAVLNKAAGAAFLSRVRRLARFRAMPEASPDARAIDDDLAGAVPGEDVTGRARRPGTLD